MKPILSAFILSVSLGAAVVWAQTPAKTPKMASEIRGYQGWKIVNAQPAAMDAAVAMMCAPPTIFRKNNPPTPFQGSAGPHAKKWVNVFVNPLGEAAMMTQKTPKFPVGSVIVKQKLSAQKAKKGANLSPELLTIMIKREHGFDPKNDDWEWMVTDGRGEKVAARGKLANCQGCHRPYAKTDWVVRSYLPDSVKKALKDLDEAPKSEG